MDVEFNLPIHPFTGLRAVGIVAGRPVWPILGGAEGGDGGGDSSQGDGDNDGQKDPDSNDGADSNNDSSGSADDEIAALLGELKLTPRQAAARLRNAPKWETRARENHKKAQQAETLETQVEQLRSAIAERDAREVERAAKAAMQDVRAHLRGAGVDPDDVKEILARVNGVDLLKDGDVDEAEVKKLAASLLKVAGRVQPDPDQGKKGGERKPDMNALIRKAAGRGSITIN